MKSLSLARSLARGDPHDIKGQPGLGDYTALRAATAELGEDSERPKVADHAFNIRPIMEVSPEGTYIASRPQSQFSQRETDYVNGPTRSPSVAAYVAIAAVAAAGRADDQQPDEGATVLAENAANAKREQDNGQASEQQEVASTPREAGAPKSAQELFAAERAEYAEDVREFEAMERERGQEAGFGMSR
jgi:hypothetical protein